METQRKEYAIPADAWREIVPPSLQSKKARLLFEEAVKAGLLYYDPDFNFFLPADTITKPQLAYWCKRASTYLGIDNGRMQKTNKPRTRWAPFDALFGYSDRRPLRATMHNIEERTAPEEYTARIDAFFDALEGAPAPSTPTSTTASTEQHK